MSGKTILSAGVLAVLLAASAHAHHPGGTGNTGGAGPINTFSATTLEQGQSAVAFLYEYISLFGLNDASLIAAAANHQHAHSIKTIESAALGAAFGITNDLMLLVRLPYVRRSDIREGEHEHGPGGVLNSVVARGDAAGIGDMTTLGQWRFYNNPTTATEAAVLFGLRLPTGRTDLLDRTGALFETEFQPGSGAVDKLVGLAFTQRFGAWSFDASVLHAFAGTGAQQTSLGDRFQYNAAVSYRLIGAALQPPATPAQGQARTRPHRHDGHSHGHSHSGDHSHDEAPAKPAPQWRVDLVLELNGEWHDKQTVAGERDPNSGGNVVYVSPGLRVGYGSVSGFASVGLPAINDMNGLQSKPGYRAVSGVVAVF